MGILEILDRPIAFHRVLVTVTNSFTAAGFLSQAIYWQRRIDEGAWFYKTRDDWFNEIGLTRSEQETVRKILVKLGVLNEERRGIPAKLYFQVNVERLEELIALANKKAGFPPTGGQENSQQCGDVPANSEVENQPTIKGTKITHKTTHKTTSIDEPDDPVKLPEWLPQESWKDFLDFRKEIKKPMTEYAKSLAIKKLTKLRDAGNDPVSVIEQSILSSWAGLFSVKADSTSQPSASQHSGLPQELQAGNWL